MTIRATKKRAGEVASRIVSDELIELAKRARAAKDDLEKFKPSGFFICYHRFSPRPDQSGRESKEAARLLLLQYGKALGLQPRTHHATGVPLFFCDGGEKRDSPDRPQLMKALYESEPGDIIVVAEPDRISNDEMFYAAIETTVHEAGCRFEYCDGTPPATDEWADVIRSLRLAVNRTELKKKRKRAKDHFKNLRRLGLWPAYANRPYGHDKVVIGKDSAGRNVYQLAENREEQAVILYILMLRLRGPGNGGGKRAIADRLNAEGIKPPQGKKWWGNKIMDIINREFDRYGIPAGRNEAELHEQHMSLRRLGIIKAGRKVIPWSERKHEILKKYPKPEYLYPPNRDESLLFNDSLNPEINKEETEA